jgi:hypothetical protein
VIEDSGSLYAYQAHLQTRWASPENFTGEKGGACRGNDGRKRSAAFPLAAGESRTLAEAEGPGLVRRLWVTISDRSPKMVRGLRLDLYWDGAATPAVSAPLGDFFCQPLGQVVTFQNALFASPEGRSFNCYLPMPFRTGLRVVVTNESDADLSMFFYDLNYTLGDVHGEDALYLHAHWRRENPTTLRQDYTLLPRVEGRGRFLGVNLGAIADTYTYYRSWWGEGEVKVYLDGDTDCPTLSGTGTEDYIGTGWGQGQYAHLYQGCHLADRDNYRYGFYRLHVPDPIFFHEDVCVTIQQIGCCVGEQIARMAEAGHPAYHSTKLVDPAEAVAAGYALFERQDDWSSCAYFYLNRPENGLPALAPVGERVAGLG